MSGPDTPLGKFHEHFNSQSFQPFVEYEWHATSKLAIIAGIKSADYNLRLNQYQDASTVGCLGATPGLPANATATAPAVCPAGGRPS